jgi:hypothetical protein
MMAERLRLAGRIIGFGMAGFFLFFFIGESAMEVAATGLVAFTAALTIEGILLGVITGVALAGCILSFWRVRASGIMLVAVAGALAAHIAVFAARNHLLALSMLGLPYLIAGILFLNSWRLSQELA